MLRLDCKFNILQKIWFIEAPSPLTEKSYPPHVPAAHPIIEHLNFTLSHRLPCLIVRQFQSHGIRGIYQGLFSTIIFRTAFFVWWSTYELYTRLFKRHTRLSDASINFWAGGLSAQTFWLAAFPFDVVKQRVMTDALDVEKRRYRGWWEAWVRVWKNEGFRGYYRGFVPCVLRAFPANAAALFMFEQTMRVMKT